MASYTVLIIGGASFDSEIKDLFENHNLYVEHYDARKSQSLRKQNIPKNTIGVIITVDRSHMAFGNSNELTRYLQANNIPFVFSSGNFASFNSSKLLLQKISKLYPDNIKLKEYIPENIQKLDYYKKEWQKYEKIFSVSLNKWFEIESEWNNTFNRWNKILENWKIYLLEWKELQTVNEFKELKKKINKEASHLLQWRQEIHDFGLKIERNINFTKQWKINIEESTLEILEIHENLKLTIGQIKELNDKQKKTEFKNWKVDFEKWKEDIEIWEKQYLEWLNIYPQAFVNINEWEKATNTWFISFKKKKES